MKGWSGSVPRYNGIRSGRSKNLRIRNTAFMSFLLSTLTHFCYEPVRRWYGWRGECRWSEDWRGWRRSLSRSVFTFYFPVSVIKNPTTQATSLLDKDHCLVPIRHSYSVQFQVLCRLTFLSHLIPIVNSLFIQCLCYRLLSRKRWKFQKNRFCRMGLSSNGLSM
jgi:hypothetical protein